jgi:hypothetical protein
MSLSTDVLSRATPTRLICRGGRWVLELTRLEAVDRDVFQPRLTRLEGSESILAALRRSEEGQHLASGAAQIMRSPRLDEDRAFEVNEGDWIPSADASLPAGRASAAIDNDAADTARALAELRAELVVLRASHARLRDRVIDLEAALSGGVPAHANARPARGSRTAQRRRSEPPPAFAPAQPTNEPLANPAAFAATQASPGLGQSAAAAAPAPVAADAPIPTFEELAKALSGEPVLAPLAVPSLPSLLECLATLMGAAPAVEKASETAFDKLDRPQLCKLLDDEGRERGAIVLELKAAVLLGAGLLALPRDEALRQVRENDPSEDALLAMSEICNNLTGPVNAVAGNDHVRSTALTSGDVSDLPSPRARLDLTLEGSRFAIAMF